MRRSPLVESRPMFRRLRRGGVMLPVRVPDHCRSFELTPGWCILLGRSTRRATDTSRRDRLGRTPSWVARCERRSYVGKRPSKRASRYHGADFGRWRGGNRSRPQHLAGEPSGARRSLCRRSRHCHCEASLEGERPMAARGSPPRGRWVGAGSRRCGQLGRQRLAARACGRLRVSRLLSHRFQAFAADFHALAAFVSGMSEGAGAHADQAAEAQRGDFGVGPHGRPWPKIALTSRSSRRSL